MEDDLQWKTTFNGRQPSMEDDLRWKMTFSGRRPSMEDNLRWKTTFGGRQSSVEDNLRLKRTFSGRKTLLEDNLRWKMTFSGRRPLMGDTLGWKMNFGGRRHSVKKIWSKMIIFVAFFINFSVFNSSCGESCILVIYYFTQANILSCYVMQYQYCQHIFSSFDYRVFWQLKIFVIQCVLLFFRIM